MNSSFIDAMKNKGYTPYMCDMLDKLADDVKARVDELSKLTGLNFQLTVE